MWNVWRFWRENGEGMKKTTEIGYINKNNQKNLGYAGGSETHYNQNFFEMECLDCGHRYFANGCDVWQRKCPACQVDKKSVYSKVAEEIKLTFQNAEVGREYTSAEIKEKVNMTFGRNKSSVIPSDYCYNRDNDGINYKNSIHLFRYIESGKYEYLGENYPYNGKIYHRAKGEKFDIAVGEVVDGVATFFDSDNRFNENKKIEIRKEIHKTKREIGLQLRFKVFKRDNFKCCICGASPAKDPDVELHVDHIIPWSKGGETVYENLQTLCSKCNIGKSNL